MKIWYGMITIGTATLILLFPTVGQTCPNCFASTAKNVLHTYYVSAIFLSLLPFGILAFISIWSINEKKNAFSKSLHITTNKEVSS